jgi:hypothetical protein
MLWLTQANPLPATKRKGGTIVIVSLLAEVCTNVEGGGGDIANSNAHQKTCCSLLYLLHGLNILYEAGLLCLNKD